MKYCIDHYLKNYIHPNMCVKIHYGIVLPCKKIRGKNSTAKGSNLVCMTIHTFELSTIVTAQEYRDCREYLFHAAKQQSVRCYDDSNGWLNYTGYHSVGIHLSLRMNCSRPGALIRLRINPSVLLGNHDPTALFSPSKKEVKQIAVLLNCLFEPLPIKKVFRIFDCSGWISARMSISQHRSTC